MGDFEPPYESEPQPYPLDRALVVGRLQEFGVDIEPEDLDGLDDEAVMGVILNYSTMYDLDIDDVLPEVTPIEHRTKGEEGEPYSNEI